MHREVAVFIDRCRSIIRTCETLIVHVEDLHGVAYERQVIDQEKVRGGGDDFNPLTGDPHARRVWGRLSGRVRDTDDVLIGFRETVLNLLNKGEQRPEKFGTAIAAADFARALKAQVRRDQRGEYVPARNIAQPKYPGKGK